MADLPVRSIMMPRGKVWWINADAALDRRLASLRDADHEMSVVSCGRLEAVVGVVRKQDVLDAHLGGRSTDPLEVMRPPVVVHDGATVLGVLELFKNQPAQMAIVVDEHGAVQGIVTQTDLLEAVAGDIPAEHADQAFVQQDDGALLIDAATPIAAVLPRLDLPPALASGAHYTLAGPLPRTARSRAGRGRSVLGRGVAVRGGGNGPAARRRGADDQGVAGVSGGYSHPVRRKRRYSAAQTAAMTPSTTG